jgi:hypothetical protein
LGEPDENAFGTADVAEAVRGLVLDNLTAGELRTVLGQPLKCVVDVVNREHHAEVSQGVHGSVSVVGDHLRREEARELDPAVAVWYPHHGDLDALVAQAGDAPCPLALDQRSPFELEAQFEEELDGRCEVFDDDADVVHPESHLATLQKAALNALSLISRCDAAGSGPGPGETRRLHTGGRTLISNTLSGSSTAGPNGTARAGPPWRTSKVGRVKLRPMLQARDVAVSSQWYQTTIGLRSGHGGDEFEMLFAGDDFVLQLHRFDAHEHGLLQPGPDVPVGAGVSLWFETADRDAFDSLIGRARIAGTMIAEEPKWNSLAHHHESTLIDPDGYIVVVNTPFETTT